MVFLYRKYPHSAYLIREKAWHSSNRVWATPRHLHHAGNCALDANGRETPSIYATESRSGWVGWKAKGRYKIRTAEKSKWMRMGRGHSQHLLYPVSPLSPLATSSACYPFACYPDPSTAISLFPSPSSSSVCRATFAIPFVLTMNMDVHWAEYILSN